MCHLPTLIGLHLNPICMWRAQLSCLTTLESMRATSDAATKTADAGFVFSGDDRKPDNTGLVASSTAQKVVRRLRSRGHTDDASKQKASEGSAMTGRRAYGSGSIRLRNGKYQAIVRYEGADGKRHQRAKSWQKKTDAQNWIVGEISRIRREGPPSTDGSQTISEFLHNWLKSGELADLSESTAAWYRSAVIGHLVPGVGHLRLDRVGSMQLDQFLTSKRCSGRLDGQPGGLGSSSLRRLHVTLTKAFGYAERMKLIISNVNVG